MILLSTMPVTCSKEKKKKEARVSKLIENPGRHYA